MAVFALLSLSVVVLFVSQQKHTVYQETEGVASIPNTVPQTTLDSDDDGLKDWEEVLWGTDPFNPDTDNDGTDDGVEIAVGRNPLVSSSGGVLDTLDSEVPYKKSSAEAVKLSETDVTSRTFFKKYLTLLQSGEGLDEKTRNTLVTETVEDMFAETPSPQIYDESDITIVTSTKEALQNYGNTIMTIINSYAEQNPENEVILFDEFLRTQNERVLEELVDASAMYEQISEDFVTVAVPEKLVSIHLDLIEWYLILSRSLNHMGKIFEDPVLGASGFKKYIEVLEQQDSTAIFLKEYFNKNGVSFNITEPGYIWNI